MNRYFNIALSAAIGLIATACSKESDFMESFSYDFNASYKSESMAGDEISPETGTGDKFDEITDNPFIKTSVQNVSTFSIDADGASYAYMRRMLGQGYQIDPDAVRIEEFLNYFTFDYPDPEGDATAAINAEIGDCPWAQGHKLIRLGIKGKSLTKEETPAANFVFLVDVSGSMDSSDKLDLLKDGLLALADNLNPDDRISIITYAGEVQKILASTPAKESGAIKKAIKKLEANGSTNGEKAMEMAYEEALANYIEGGNNRVIMGTDGDFNVGITSTDGILEMAKSYADKGIYLTICGFGTGNLNDSMMEKVSNSGNGTYQYIDSEEEMVKVFVTERSKFVAVANDAKVQVTFDSTKVAKYRLIGYENRVMNNEEFEDDTKDAGEIGAGQTITALYEIVPAEGWDGTAGTFDFRYKKALGSESLPLSIEMTQGDTVSDEFSFAAGIAAYGMLLRNSEYKGTATYDSAKELVSKGVEHGNTKFRKELVNLIDTAKKVYSD